MRVLRVVAAHDSGTILNRVGANGQVYGGVVMGIGQALTEGDAARRDGQAAQPAPARLQAPDRGGRCLDRHRLGRDARARRRPERLEGDRRAALRADAGRDRECDRAGDGNTRPPAADDRRSASGRRCNDARRSSSRRRSRRRCASLPSAPGRCRRHRPRRPRTAGQDAAARAARRDPPTRRASRSCARPTGRCGWARSRRTPRSLRTRSFAQRLTALADAAAIVGSHATRAHGHARRQPDERLAGDGDRRPAPLLRRLSRPALGVGSAL